MCFSAQASFIAGVGLSIAGITTLKKNKNKSMQRFATIPLLFGIQQICEGFVWITQGDASLIIQNELARYAFLFFAFLVWPFWIPFSIYALETKEKKKRCLASFIGIGTVVASGLLWALVHLGATSAISCNHIEYIVNLPETFEPWILFWYCAATIGPLFVSDKKVIRIFGILIAVSVIISGYFYTAYFTSVWCFFAALLSFYIHKIVRG